MSRRRPLLALATLAMVLALPATSHAAVATLSAVNCDAGGAVATLENSGATPAKYVILRNDRAIANVVVQPGATVTRTVPIAEGQAAQVTVRSGASYVSSYVRRQCSGAATGSESTAVAGASEAPFRAGPVVPGTGTHSAESTPAARDAAAGSGIDFPQAAIAWPLVGLAALSLLLALVLASGRLRRRQPERDAQPAPAVRRRV